MKTLNLAIALCVVTLSLNTYASFGPEDSMWEFNETEAYSAQIQLPAFPVIMNGTGLNSEIDKRLVQGNGDATNEMSEYQKLAARVLGNNKVSFSKPLYTAKELVSYVKKFVQAIGPLYWERGLRKDIRKIFKTHDRFVVYECGDIDITLFVGVVAGNCTGLELHKNGSAKLAHFYKFGFNFGAAVEVLVSKDREVRAGAVLVERYGEIDLASGVALVSGAGLDWLDFNIANDGEESSWTPDSLRSTGLGASLIKLSAVFVEGLSGTVEFNLSKEFFEEMMNDYDSDEDPSKY